MVVLVWLGTAALMVSPYIIDTKAGKLLAIIGLALLSIQAYNEGVYNFVLLNICGIVGYSISLIKKA